MKALSIRQPWADMILHHGKDIENRSWNTNFRGRVWVHAAKRWTAEEKQTYSILAKELNLDAECSPVLGHIIGSVEIVDVVRSSYNFWFDGPYGFVLERPKPLSQPFPYKGRLGFFEVIDHEMREAIKTAIRQDLENQND